MNNFTKFKTNKWFSIIEILVAIFIFSLWLVSVYAIISSTLKLNDYNKNHIIASNLAREQIELIKNIRDSNFKTILKYNQINPKWSYENPKNFFSSWYYFIENDYSPWASFPIKVRKIKDFAEWKAEISSPLFWKMRFYMLCLDSEGKYRGVNTSWNCPSSRDKKTRFFKYLKIDEVKYSSWWSDYTIADALKIKSKVIWYMRWYHETEINTIITDWQRL